MKPYYQDEAVTIYHGSCLDILPALGQVDLILTDPPYEVEAHTRGRRAFSGTTDAKFKKGVCEERPIAFGAMDEATRGAVSREFHRLSTGWIMAFCQVEAVHLWKDCLEGAGARYFRTQIWDKVDAAPQFTGDRPGMAFECIVTCWNQETRSSWNGGGRRGTYRHATVKEKWGHDTVKPLPLMKDLAALFSDPGETILDPFMGSGTTLRAAKDLGRKAIGIELEEKYCELAAQRMGQEVLAL